MLKLILLITVVGYCCSSSVGQIGQWHDPPSRFKNCSSVENAIEPYIECVNIYVNHTSNKYILEYHFGFKDCNPCCVNIPRGNNNKLISSHLDLSWVNLPTLFCPGYHANGTVFNVTYNPNYPKYAYYISWKLGNITVNSSTILPPTNYSPPSSPRSYVLPFGPACKAAPLNYVGCFNPCDAKGEKVAIPIHPLKTQRYLQVNPVATCGCEDWTNKSVVIIGGGSGLGLSLYKDFKQVGANVKVGGRLTGEGDRSIAAYPEIDPKDLIGHNMDVRSPYEVQKAWDYVISKLPTPLYVIYMPGVAGFSPTNYYRTEDAKALFDINVFGMVKAYQLFAQQTGQDDNRSKFHVIVSNSAIQHTPTIAPYSISKRAQEAFVRAYIVDRIYRQLNGRNDTLNMVSASFPSAMRTNWAYYNWQAPSDLSYLADQIKTPRDGFSDGTHNNPLVTPAFSTSSQIFNLLSLPSSVIDAINATMTIPYNLDPTLGQLFVDMEDVLLSTAINEPLETQARYIASSFSGAYIGYTYGKDKCAFGQL